ncbi:hypothetical protein SATRM34S_00792 [Streptomyces atroolivaceus]
MVLEAINGEKTSMEKTRRPISPITVTTAPGRRASQRIRPPSSSRWDHQKNRTALSDAVAPPADGVCSSVVVAETKSYPVNTPSHTRCRHLAHQRAGGRSQTFS